MVKLFSKLSSLISIKKRNSKIKIKKTPLEENKGKKSNISKSIYSIRLFIMEFRREFLCFYRVGPSSFRQGQKASLEFIKFDHPWFRRKRGHLPKGQLKKMLDGTKTEIRGRKDPNWGGPSEKVAQNGSSEPTLPFLSLQSFRIHNVLLARKMGNLRFRKLAPLPDQMGQSTEAGQCHSNEMGQSRSIETGQSVTLLSIASRLSIYCASASSVTTWTVLKWTGRATISEVVASKRARKGIEIYGPTMGRTSMGSIGALGSPNGEA